MRRGGGVRGAIFMGEINPGKCPLGKLPPENFTPIPQRKKKLKKEN